MLERMSLAGWAGVVRTLVLGVGLMLGAAACGEDDPDDGGNNGDVECLQACAPNQVCNEGACVCEAGFLDCDGIAANGCEHEGDECPVACIPESDADLCQRAGAVCGEVTLEDNCGDERTVTCGTCDDGEHCDAGQCVSSCVEETDAAFCARHDAACGELTGEDNCGNERTVTCGTCGDDERCEENQCVCIPEEDDAFCDRLDATCGELTADDNCGEPRTVVCGTCEDGEVCSESNVCVCEAESDEEFCATYGKDCGEFTAEDVCGNERTALCGTCAEGELCGMDVENVCGMCEPEDDQAFCDRLEATCGELTALDNCEVSRTVNCGACEDGGICTSSNVCCEPEDDVTFCANQGASCGNVMAADSCGQIRMANCGTCSGDDICRSNNTCGPACEPETDAQLCAAAGAACGDIVATDACGDERTVTCGTCPDGENCLGNQCLPPDGEWIDEFCMPDFAIDCATGLSCIFYAADWSLGFPIPYGTCKQLCDSDADCSFGGDCFVNYLREESTGDTFGFCGQPKSVGETCGPSWTESSELCWDPSDPNLYLECVNGSCSYVCDWSTNPNQALPCPSGMSCGSSTVFDPYFGLDINLCQ